MTFYLTLIELCIYLFKRLVAHQVARANMHHHTKFRQNQSNGCRDITFNVFKMVAICYIGF